MSGGEPKAAKLSSAVSRRIVTWRQDKNLYQTTASPITHQGYPTDEWRQIVCRYKACETHTKQEPLESPVTVLRRESLLCLWIEQAHLLKWHAMFFHFTQHTFRVRSEAGFRVLPRGGAKALLQRCSRGSRNVGKSDCGTGSGEVKHVLDIASGYWPSARRKDDARTDAVLKLDPLGHRRLRR